MSQTPQDQSFTPIAQSIIFATMKALIDKRDERGYATTTINGIEITFNPGICYVSVIIEKNSPGELEAIEAVEDFEKLLKTMGHKHEALKREVRGDPKVNEGKPTQRTDGLKIILRAFSH